MKEFYPKVEKAKKRGDKKALSALGKEGAVRKAERARETAIMSAEITQTINDLERSLLESGALLQAYSLKDKVNEEGDVEPVEEEIDPDIIAELEATYIETEKQVFLLKRKLAELNPPKKKLRRPKNDQS